MMEARMDVIDDSGSVHGATQIDDPGKVNPFRRLKKQVNCIVCSHDTIRIMTRKKMRVESRSGLFIILPDETGICDEFST